jgi:cytochrome c-type biogenesis protein CcmF
LDALDLGKISVGAPYFASVFTPLMIPVYLFAGFAPLVPWKKASLDKLFKKLWPLSLMAASIGLIATLSFWNIHDIKVTAGLSLAAWLMLTALFPFGKSITGGHSLATIKGLSPSIWGMTLAHLGIGVFLVGVLLSGAYSEEKIIKMAPGEVTTLAGYSFQFEGVSPVNGPNYRAQEGRFLVNPGPLEILLKTQKRIYQTQKNPMTEAAIDPGLTRDLYVALGDPMEGGAWSVRLYYKPFIRWVWLGGLLMMLGGLLSISDRRYRMAPHSTAPVTQG